MEQIILSVLPKELKNFIQMVEKELPSAIEEIRIRENRPLEISYGGKFSYLTKDGHITNNWSDGYIVTTEDSIKILTLLSNHSLYLLEEELKRGYITIQGGHRVGLSGKVILDKSEVKSIRDVTSFNIRVAHEVIGVADKVMPYLYNKQTNRVHNTLIISPPQCGKTTLLRDIARNFSYGNKNLNIRSKKVGIVDERSELAGAIKGVPQLDVGPRTDILDGCPKAEGMIMLIRSMSPEVIIVDEIGRIDDSIAINDAINAGVAIITSVHGFNVEDIMKRPILAKLINEKVFNRYIILSRRFGVGTVESILDDNLKSILVGERK